MLGFFCHALAMAEPSPPRRPWPGRNQDNQASTATADQTLDCPTLNLALVGRLAGPGGQINFLAGIIKPPARQPPHLRHREAAMPSASPIRAGVKKAVLGIRTLAAFGWSRTYVMVVSLASRSRLHSAQSSLVGFVSSLPISAARSAGDNFAPAPPPGSPWRAALWITRRRKPPPLSFFKFGSGDPVRFSDLVGFLPRIASSGSRKR